MESGGVKTETHFFRHADFVFIKVLKNSGSEPNGVKTESTLESTQESELTRKSEVEPKRN
jgi:hypothetical protein